MTPSPVRNPNYEASDIHRLVLINIVIGDKGQNAPTTLLVTNSILVHLEGSHNGCCNRLVATLRSWLQTKY